VGLERGPLSLVSTTEELLGRKSSGSGLVSREYGPRDPSRWPRRTFYPQKFTLTSPTSGVRSQTQATEFNFCFLTNAENLTNSWSVKSKSKSIWDFNLILFFTLYLVLFLEINSLYTKCVPCLFTYCKSLPKFYHQHIVIIITICCPGHQTRFNVITYLILCKLSLRRCPIEWFLNIVLLTMKILELSIEEKWSKHIYVQYAYVRFWSLKFMHVVFTNTEPTPENTLCSITKTHRLMVFKEPMTV
jgi:hypothetical protein